MRRLLLVIPVILFIILSACGNDMTINPGVVAMVVQSQTATAWTPTITPSITLTPNLSLIMGLLNPVLPESTYLARVDELERTIGARYEVVDVIFAGENGVAEVFKVYIHCECGEKTDCCSSERMFAVTMRKMEFYWNSIHTQMPGTVKYLSVVCLDHGAEFAVLSAEWADVRSFLDKQITGSQFGSRVTRGYLP